MKVKYRKRALLFTSLLLAALLLALLPAGLPAFADAGSWTQTLDADFNAGTKTQVAVASDSVKLATLATTTTLTPSADSWVRNESGYLNTNYGTDTQLRIMAGTRWSLVTFNLSSIPTGATITSATMKIYVSADGTYTGGGTLDACRITSSWTESGVTYYNRPTHAAATSSVTVTGTGWTPYWDVKSDVQKFVNGTYSNYGWWLTDNPDTFGYGCYFRCWSRDYTTDTTLRPQLVVTYSSAAYYSSGNLVSSKYDTGQASNFGSISFTINKPANTDLKFQIRTAATAAGLDSATWYGPTGTGDYYQTSGANINSIHNGSQWVQYKAYFSTTDTAVTPRLDDITIAYSLAAVAPTVTTQDATSVEATTATGNGNISNTGGASCTRRGFCYKVGTSGDPTTTDTVAFDDGSFGTGAYTKAISGLSSGTSYRVRAYAINSAGTGYGSTVTMLTKPATPTNVAATDGTYPDKVVVTWTKSTGATGYHVYRDSSDLGLLGDVATYDDTGAGAPTITPGSSVASDGTYTDKVALSLSGAGTSKGTTHTYKVVAKNGSGNSADSNTDTGYRAPGTLTYLWQRSAADSDADYSNIDGATTASYDDTGAPADGSGRYYRCVEDAAGASQQISSADRGYRYHPTIEITAPADVISGWSLSPSGTQPQTQTGTLGVTCIGNWQVTVKDADTATAGKMTDYYGSAYGTTKLANFMHVAAQTYEVTLPTEGVIATGTGNASVDVTFKQTVSWSDQVLAEGHSYRIIVTFTGSMTP